MFRIEYFYFLPVVLLAIDFWKYISWAGTSPLRPLLPAGTCTGMTVNLSFEITGWSCTGNNCLKH